MAVQVKRVAGVETVVTAVIDADATRIANVNKTCSRDF